MRWDVRELWREHAEFGPTARNFQASEGNHTLHGVHGFTIEKRKLFLAFGWPEFPRLQLDSHFHYTGSA